MRVLQEMSSTAPTRRSFLAFIVEKTLEIDAQVGDDVFLLRIEISRAVRRRHVFRVRFWRTETFRLQPTFPQDAHGNPRDEPSDELILADWSHCVRGEWDEFRADSREAVQLKVLREVGRSLRHFGGHVGASEPRRRSTGRASSGRRDRR